MYLVSKRRTEETLERYWIRQEIKNEYKEAKLNTAHLLGIKRALVSYREHMLTVLTAAEKKQKKSSKILDFFFYQQKIQIPISLPVRNKKDTQSLYNMNRYAYLLM
ncbi:unnamed protein product [Rhizopus stolonifer]